MAFTSSTRETASTTGVATPNTEAEGIEEHRLLQEWLASSGLASQRPNPTTNKPHLAGSPQIVRMSDPQCGGTFFIIDKTKNRALVCVDGHLRLEDAECIDSGNAIPKHWQWRCTERNGFKGFQNVKEGGFLGHDIWWDFYAKVYHHKLWEDFTLSKREDKHYWIQALNWWTQWQVSARPDGSGIFAERGGGTPWEFVKVC